jgi:hypothetical protein
VKASFAQIHFSRDGEMEREFQYEAVESFMVGIDKGEEEIY